MAWIYSYVFIIAYSLLSLFFYVNKRKSEQALTIMMSSISVFIFVFFLNYHRHIVSDSLNYKEYFEYISNINFYDVFSLDDRYMYGYRLWSWFNSHLYNDIHLFFAITAVVMLILIYRASIKLLGIYDAFLIVIIYSMYPFFSLYSSSGLRQGFALCLLLLAIVFYLNNEIKKSILIFISALFFHKTTLLCVFLYFARSIHYKKALLIYFIIVFLSYVGVFSDLGLAILGDYNYLLAGNYLGDDSTDYITGFRVSFFLFSLLPILVFFWIKGYEEDNSFFKIYLILNSFMYVFNFIPFHDRIAAYSWFLIPIVCIYMIRNSGIKKNILMSLFFLFMNVFAFRYYNWSWYFGG